MSKRVKIYFFFQFNAKEIEWSVHKTAASFIKVLRFQIYQKQLTGSRTCWALRQGSSLCSDSTLLLGIEVGNSFTESIFVIFHELWDISSFGFSSCVDQGSIHNSTCAKNSSLPYKCPPARVLISRLDFPNLDASQPVRNRRSYAIELDLLQRFRKIYSSCTDFPYYNDNWKTFLGPLTWEFRIFQDVFPNIGVPTGSVNRVTRPAHSVHRITIRAD